MFERKEKKKKKKKHWDNKQVQFDVWTDFNQYYVADVY